MTNDVIFYTLIILIFSIVIALIVGAIVKDGEEISITFYSFIFIVLALIISEIIYYIVFSDQDVLIFIKNIQVPIIISVIVSFFVLTKNFYRFYSRHSEKSNYVLYSFAAFTFLISLTSKNHSLLYQEESIKELMPLKVFEYELGIWSYLSIFFVIGLFVGIVYIIISQHRDLPESHKTPSIFFIIGFGILSLSITINYLNNSIVNIGIFGAGLSCIFILAAVCGNIDVNLLLLARNEIFNHLAEYIFIVDNDDLIIDVNDAAKGWLDQMTFFRYFEQRETYLSEIYEHLIVNNAAKINKNKIEEAGTDILLLYSGQYIFYNVKEKPLYNKQGEKFGTFVYFLDITRYKMMITRLEKAAAIDSLTGLSNRFVYDNNKLVLDHPNYYPLSVIIGDVNGLKTVNDTLGHQVGDQLLIVIAMHIKEHCPPKATVARCGGDEFFVLLPNTNINEANIIKNKIQASLDTATEYPFTPSISLGIATKSHSSQDLDELIREADEAMYQEKGDRRRKS